MMITLVEAPTALTVRVHRELPRDPKRPHFVQTEPIDHTYVRLKYVLKLADQIGLAQSSNGAAFLDALASAELHGKQGSN